jgi:hypothetical protein
MTNKIGMRVIAWSYSLSSGLATAGSLGYSLYKLSENVVIGAVGAAIGFIVDSVAAYGFQGRAILGEPETETGQSYVLVTENRSRTLASVTAQLLYTTFSTAKNYGQRYFMLNELLQLFAAELSEGATQGIVVTAVILKQLFDMSNEQYEANELLAEHIDPDKVSTVPCYMPLFKPISGPKMRKGFIIVGCLDHTINDDLMPWLGFFPQKLIQILSEDKNYQKLAIGIGCGLSLPLVTLVFLQTYLFEGKHAEEHLAQLNEAAATDNEPRSISPLLAKILEKSFWLMALLHGASDAMPVYLITNELLAVNLNELDQDWPKLTAAIALTLAVFASKSLGTAYSEVKEAAEELHRMSNQEVLPHSIEGVPNSPRLG